MKKITEKTKLSEIMKINPEAGAILFEEGLTCIGCPMSLQETLEQGCKAHGMSDKEIKKLVEKINKIAEKKKQKKRK